MNKQIDTALFRECPGCGFPVPPPKPGGSQRKWCSVQCSRRAAKATYKARHPERVKWANRQYRNRYYRENRDAIRLRVKLHTFGLTAEQYDELCERADGRCEVCARAFGPRKQDQAHIDHCHITGAVRGLLCATCNWALGNAKDDPEVLRRLADYIEDHRADC